MSRYNSKNTKVLATHDEPHCGHVNKRMLLLHEMENGRIEYVIGSYFTVVAELPRGEVHEDGSVSGNVEPFSDEAAFGKFWKSAIKSYSWDWGHYFQDFGRAMAYWETHVTGPEYDENTCPHCGSSGGLVLEESDDYEAPRIYWFRCEDCGKLSRQVWSLAENVPTAG